MWPMSSFYLGYEIKNKQTFLTALTDTEDTTWRGEGRWVFSFSHQRSNIAVATSILFQTFQC